MAGNACVLYPLATDGKESKLYKKLLDITENRPQTNWFYASYLASNMGDILEQAGVPRNTQGEHNAEEVLNYLDWSKIQAEMGEISTLERQIGAKDLQGERVNFTNAEEALKIADTFNDSHKGLVANVTVHGDAYQIMVSEKNAINHTQPLSVKERLKIWEVYKQVFNEKGIDIENMPQEIQSKFSAYNTGLANELQGLQRMAINYMDKKQALTLFSIDPNSKEVQRVVSSFGSLEDAAQAVADVNHNTGNVSHAQIRLLNNAITKCRQMQGIDTTALRDQVNEMSQNIRTSSPEESVKQTLHQLNKKYNIGINEIHRISDKANTLSKITQDAAITLERELRQLENERGKTEESKRLEGIINKLMREISCKRYCSGIFGFMEEASSEIEGIDKMLLDIPTSGTEMEKAIAKAKTLQNIKTLRDKYYDLLSALADEHTQMDEDITQEDIDNIRETAKQLKNFFDKKDEVIKEEAESAMIGFLRETMGDTAPNGQSIINVVRMAATDSSMWDFLYSVGRASNPIIATMGSIIRNAENSRDAKLNDIALRIRRATDALYKSGSTSEFMYEDDGHIISDINWDAYAAARKAAIKAFYKQGLKDYDLKAAIEQWEEANTEDKEVDSVNHRTERIPNSLYRKEFPNLTPEQKEYYDTMMQIKGEIGTYLPSYAQHQYLPPQLRRNMLDALSKSKNLNDVWRAVKNKIQDLWVVREDDTDYKMNGIIDGNEYDIAKGDFNNTPLRQIPIFYVNKLKDQRELLKDFSAGVQALAGTAINYDAMSNIAQVVEFIGDFAKNQIASNNPAQADYVEGAGMRLFKDLKKFARNHNTEALIDGFIAQHIYGQNQEETGWAAKLWGNLIAYTSFKGLATNVKGAFANYTVGEMQMLIEAGAGEFYGFKDYFWAHSKLLGGAGVGGELSELLTNNVNHKGVLFRELFDPINENYTDKSHERYYPSMFRQLLNHDCSFIGYASGEYLIHYVNMYSILHNQKVLLNGKEINLYDAFEVTNKQDGNSELKLKEGVTQLNGEAITDEWIALIRKRIRYCNQTTHGSMNKEDKGLIHQHWWGRGIMNFRQWMVEHYSRRFRGTHFDDSLGTMREGYWVSTFKYLFNDKTKEAWKDGNKLDALGMFMKDYVTFMLRAQSQWHNLSEMQRYNVKRANTEILTWISLLGLSFALGEPDEHKKEFWRRWWIYQTKRMMLDTEASMPHPKAISSGLTILQSPMAGVNTLNSLLYTFYGLTNGDLFETLKSGPHKGENKYWRNIKKYNLPFFKDWEQMQRMSEDEALFQVFESTPSNR